MDFVWAATEVIAGGFVLFTIARMAYVSLVPRAGWVWVSLIVVLSVANMLLHRWLGSSINPPFFTAVLFGVTLLGLAPDETVLEGKVSEGSHWFRRGAIAVVFGTVLGWLSYIEISQL
jgi:hypothetical protein